MIIYTKDKDEMKERLENETAFTLDLLAICLKPLLDMSIEEMKSKDGR